MISRAVNLGLLAIATPSLAAGSDDEQAQVIIVTGRGLDPGLGEDVYDVTRIDRARLDHSPSNRLEDVLRDVPGFQQFRRSDSRSANPTSQGATLRALGGNASSRALLILDGVPVVDPQGGMVGTIESVAADGAVVSTERRGPSFRSPASAGANAAWSSQ